MLEVRDRRFPAHEPIPDCAGLLARLQAPPPAGPSHVAGCRCLRGVLARSLWMRMTDGFSRASRAKIARAPLRMTPVPPPAGPSHAAAYRFGGGSRRGPALNDGERRALASRSWIARACKYDAQRLGRSTSLTLQVASSVLALCHVALELGNRWILREPLPDRTGLLVRLSSPPTSRPVPSWTCADIAVIAGQMSLELGDRWVLTRQPLPDPSPWSCRAIAFVGWPRSLYTTPMLIKLLPRSLWNSVTDGSSRASRSKIARACSYDAMRLRRPARLVLHESRC